MINLTPKNLLNAEQKRNLHMLHYDGEKRYTVYCDSKASCYFEQSDCDDFEEVLYIIRNRYAELLKANPSAITVFDDDDRFNIRFGIYDNLEQKDFTITLADLNRFNLSAQILSAKKPARRKEAEESVDAD